MGADPARAWPGVEPAQPLRVAFLGPAGTFCEEALRASAPGGVEEISYPAVREAVMAVQNGDVDRAVVPIENALEGSVRATLDTLAADAPGVRIEAEVTHPVHHCLIARAGIPLERVVRLVSHPQAMAQCRRFVRERLGHAERAAASSTAEAVRLVAGAPEPWAALGSRLSAELYSCQVLAERVEDREGNVTRFVWLAPVQAAGNASGREAARPLVPGARAKTSIVFWGFDDDSPGALVAVLSELASRGVNLTKIESRPRRVRLGHYMFFADLDGDESEAEVSEALSALGQRVETLRVLGSYPAG
jgi:prephenate dehydratase